MRENLQATIICDGWRDEFSQHKNLEVGNTLKNKSYAVVININELHEVCYKYYILKEVQEMKNCYYVTYRSFGTGIHINNYFRKYTRINIWM